MAHSANNDAPMSREFKRLIKAPALAWPTVILCLGCLGGLGYSDYLAITGQISYWLACLINGVITYFFFSVVHDSSHGAIAKNKTVNDLFGHIGMIFFGPLAPLNFARWIHMQHHRFTNDPIKDPDHFGHIKDVFLPLRWLNFDFYYTKYFLENAGPLRKRFMSRLIIQILIVIGIVSVAIAAGYGKEVFLLWLLPTRISSALFVAMFVYLPHAPFKATAQENEYEASNIRAGWEWLLSPVMTYQNYHLVHHLYPTAPFYRMQKLWKMRLAFHLSKNPYYVGTFSVGRQVSPKHKVDC